MALRCFIDGERVKVSELKEGDDSICDFFSEQIGGMEEGGDGDGANKGNDTITLKVRDQAGDVMFFKVKKATEMKKIFEAYANRLGVNPKNLKFTLDGERLKETDTPKMLELTDDDQIDVFLEQVGGSGNDGEEETKPSGDDVVITLKVRSSDTGEEVAFKVKKSTKMQKIFEAYASRKGVQLQAVRFQTDEGKRVKGDDTPKMLELDEDSVLEVRIEQTGGFEW